MYVPRIIFKLTGELQRPKRGIVRIPKQPLCGRSRQKFQLHRFYITKKSFLVPFQYILHYKEIFPSSFLIGTALQRNLSQYLSKKYIFSWHSPLEAGMKYQCFFNCELWPEKFQINTTQTWEAFIHIISTARRKSAKRETLCLADKINAKCRRSRRPQSYTIGSAPVNNLLGLQLVDQTHVPE